MLGRVLAVTLVAFLLAAGVAAGQRTSATTAPTTGGSGSTTTGAFVPEVLMNYLHERSDCLPTSTKPARSVDNEDWTGESACTYRTTSYANGWLPGTDERLEYYNFTYEGQKAIGKAVDEAGTGVTLAMRIRLTRDAEAACGMYGCAYPRFEASFKVTVGDASCSGTHESRRWWWIQVPGNQDISATCKLSGPFRSTDLVKVDLMVATNNDITINYDESPTPRLTFAVLLNVPNVPKQQGSVPPEEAASIAVPVVFASLAVGAWALRRRE